MASSDQENEARVPSGGSALTMQDALLALQKYWTDRGCMVMQPFNTEVGAGTANPATMLRVLGPEPWHVGYVEPSVRPDDARYGENPNRLQTHTQFQVILKPDPVNPQEVYLGSLQALGVDVHAHDIRFVEDNWASPALGAWGLGWEVWLDGLEITQFTYFQQAGGLVLDPVSVEITYGIERIVMALQGVSHFKDIVYAPGISYGEVFGQAEYEMSRYYLDDADIDINRRLFESYADEARRMLEARLPVPAYVHVLKCSHTFNVLDARGAISTTERAKAFGRMRLLTRQAAQLWADLRGDLGHPLGVVTPPAAAHTGELPTADSPATMLFEIGVEELPHAEVGRGADAVRDAVTSTLAATRLGHGTVHAYATPRRIVIVVDAVAPQEPDATRTVRGPRLAAAFDAQGHPTKAAQGFARAQRVDTCELLRVEVGGVEHVAVVSTDVGRNAVAVLSDVLGQVVTGLRAEKNMRWRDAGLSFSRPIRWLVALLGQTQIPLAVSSLSAGRRTRVFRTAHAPEVDVPSAQGYVEFLAHHGIVVEEAARRRAIVAAATDLASSVGGSVDFDAESALLAEVTNLVERPTAIMGQFARDYLELPPEILTTVMRKHQRYLPVRQDGRLSPYFVAIANGDCDHDIVRAGYESVLRARYEDAAFFWRADLKTPLEQHKAGLANLTFEERLGSMAERANRVAELATELADLAHLTARDRSTLKRAGQLAKFDLASQMVIELPGLAGTIAREYALRAGETPQVAQALAEMEQPRSAGDTVPTSTVGALLALADRFDLIAGLFAIGANPSGSSDPFGLRRATIGALSILRAAPGLGPISLTPALNAAARHLTEQGIEVPESTVTDAREFMIRRYEQQLLDAGHDHTHIQAILPLADTPAAADTTRAELAVRASEPEFVALAAALQRTRRIVPPATAPTYDPARLVEPTEQRLHNTLTHVTHSLHRHTGNIGLADFMTAACPLTHPVNQFFDNVMVMTDDHDLRTSRLGLLAKINSLADRVLDWSAL